MTLFGIHLQRERWLPVWDPASPPASKLIPGTLAEVHPGQQARVIGFCASLSASRHAHLLSYGLIPGSIVRVIQHSPVTIIQVDQLELALERDLAHEVQVAPVS